MNEKKKVIPADEMSVETLDRISDSRFARNTQQSPLDTEAGAGFRSKNPIIAKDSWQVFKNQARAMWLKNYALQSKAKGTNCCQITTPLICLFIVFLIKIIAQDKISDNAPTKSAASPPIFFDVNYQKSLNLSECLQWYLYDFPGASTEQSQLVQSLLGNIPSEHIDLRSNWECESEGNKIMPYFQLPTNASTTINQEIFSALEYLNTQPLNMSSNSDAPGLDILPDGAVLFYNASQDGFSFNLQIDDNRIKQYHRDNGVTKVLTGKGANQFASMMVPQGQLGLIGYISQSAINLINTSQIIVSGSFTMANLIYASDLLNQIFSITGASLYPLALSLLLPVFMYSIVLEKEERLQEMMKMNGLRMMNYWIMNFLWNFSLYFIAVLVFVLFGFFILDATFFTETSFGNLFFMLIGWGLSQVSLGFFFQTFISKARTATIVGYILSIWTTMIGISFNFALFPPPKVLPTALRFYPPFAFCRLIYDYSQACANNGCYKSLGSITDEMVDCMLGLYFGAIFFMALSMYLHAIWPKEYGIQYHPLFCLKRFRNKQNTTDSSLSASETLKEDEDSKKEKEFVDNIDRADYFGFPLIIKSIRKVYKSEAGRPPKVAVKNFSLHIKQGEMFGLLGPNGAGKTTLISMLTGLYPPEAGNAWVAGFDILNQIDEVRREMGVCPQFDLLWPELTIAEHLYFYARIRGVPKENEKEIIEKAATEVKLGNFLGFRVRQLSGGMKRRLSVAISLVGDPKVIFLDEPTTGLDPENRRQLWDILTEARGNRAVVLTTHSMDEADVLCTRIGIITDGVLRCIGQQTRLKTLYGGGYHLFINSCKNEYTKEGKLRLEHPLSHYHTEIDKFVHEISPKAIQKAAFNGNFIYLLPLEGLEVSRIFEELEGKKDQLGIDDWGISQSTLEDVFMEIVNTSEQVHKTADEEHH